jgi:hypothetical protein
MRLLIGDDFYASLRLSTYEIKNRKMTSEIRKTEL